MNDKQRLEHVLGLSKLLEDRPDDEAITAALIAKAALTPFADRGEIDTGMGLGDACLDFWMDGKAVRVVVKRVPALDIIQTEEARDV